jgi:hypothetical protein
MGWIDTIIIGLVIAGGVMILYKALKEPLDAIGRLIKRGVVGVFDKISNRNTGGYDVIHYG